MPESYLTRSRVLKALEALGQELALQNVHGEVFIVGGAAMVLAYSSRRVTRDIDAVFEPKAIIYKAAVKIAVDLGLPDDWLNDAVKGFLSGEDRQRRVVLDVPGIEVAVASPRYLLGMKLMAARIGEDDADIELLLKLCAITTTREALQVLEDLYPGRSQLPKTRLYLEALLGPEIETAQ